ncbi:MAG: hypothetical protein WCT49_00895 [Candidatus Paceibacterota bacterium]|jgi:hypothetical protein|nr:hypothetical protein [Candidatus Paceibacterota bacterium]
MNYKKQIKMAFIIAFLFYLFPVFSLYREMFPDGECELNHNGNILRCLFFVLLPGLVALWMVVLMFFLVALYFLKEAIFLSWRKFAVWYLPIVLAFTFLIGGGSNGFNPGYGFDTESLTFFFSGLFALVSVILIIYKSIKLRGK